MRSAWAEKGLALHGGSGREGEHPLEAIPIWQGEIERVVDAKNNQAYAEAVDLLVRVRRLLIADADGCVPH